MTNVELPELRDRVQRRLQGVQRSVSAHLVREMSSVSADLDLSFSSLGALLHLRHEPGLAVTDLARRLSLSLPATSHLVERAVRRGLVERTEHPQDRRQRVLRLTASGSALVGRVELASRHAYAALTDHLTPAELARLDDALSPLGAPPPAPCAPTEDTP